MRKVGAERDQARLAALWDDLCGRGLIAGAYWAIMSHSHVAEPLKMHAFGEVHMLSHFMGGCNRHNVKELWLAQRRLDQLADTVARARRQNQETIAARDTRISELEHELSKARHQIATTYGDRSPRPPRAAPVAGPHGAVDAAPNAADGASPPRAPASLRSRPRTRDCKRCSGC